MRAYSVLAAIVGVCLLAGSAAAQMQSGYGSMSGGSSSGGMFGSRNLGSSLTAGNRTLGGSGMGAGSMGGQGNMPGAMDSSSVGQFNASDRFLRQNRQAGEFVGAGTQNTRGFVGSTQAGQQGRTGMRTGQGNFRTGVGMGGNAYLQSGAMRRGQQGQFGQNRGGQAGLGTSAIRSELRVAFESPARARTRSVRRWRSV